MKSFSSLNYFKIYQFTLVLTVLIFTFLPSTFAFERFSDYETTLFIHPPYIDVTKEIEIENYGKVGIVPGELVFRILDLTKDQVMNLTAKDSYGNVFPTNIKQGQGFVELLIEDYVPIFAKSKQKIIISYKLKFETNSLFFYTFTYPLIDTTLPIKHLKLNVKTPKKLHITYAPGIKCEKDNCFWEFNDVKKESVTFEVSYIPFPLLKVPAVNIFWYGVISLIILLILIQFLIRKFSYRRSWI